MLRYGFFIIIVLFAVACKSTGKLSIKAQKEQARLAREKAIADSLATVARLDSLAKLRAIARLDSIRVADSLAAIPKINYDTVLIATLQRTPCYGKCAHYEIRLYASGYATFEGIANVKHIGFYETRVSPSLIESLLARAGQIGYFNFADRYPLAGRAIADFPLCVSSLCKENLKKIIYDRNDAPIELVRYEQYFDSLFEDVNWQLIKK